MFLSNALLKILDINSAVLYFCFKIDWGYPNSFFLIGKIKITRVLKVKVIIKLPSRFKFCKVYSLYLYLKDGVHTKLKMKTTRDNSSMIESTESVATLMCVLVYYILEHK